MRIKAILILISLTLLLVSCAHVQTPEEEALCILDDSGMCASAKDLE
jgi:hypothetical protein